MTNEVNENKLNPDQSLDREEAKDLFKEVYEDLNEFREVKKTIRDLLKYRQSLMDIENNDFEKINEYKGKAIDAINHLFDDVVPNKPEE